MIPFSSSFLIATAILVILTIPQESLKRAYEDEDGSTLHIQYSRTVSITCPHNGFKDGLAKTIGAEYTVVFWHDPETPLNAVNVKSSWLSGGKAANNYVTDKGSRATQVWVPVEQAHNGVHIEVSWEVSA